MQTSLNVRWGIWPTMVAWLNLVQQKLFKTPDNKPLSVILTTCSWHNPVLQISDNQFYQKGPLKYVKSFKLKVVLHKFRYSMSKFVSLVVS